MDRFDIKNAETGVCHKTVEARSQAEALQRFATTDDEHIVTFDSPRNRPYLTGFHGICYVAERVTAAREP